MGNFVLSRKKAPDYWDKVKFSAKADDGEWVDFEVDFKFARWTSTEIDAFTAKIVAIEDKHEKLTIDQRVEFALEYVKDWKVDDDKGEPSPLTAENLKAFFDFFPGAYANIWGGFLMGRHGRKEKN